MDYQAIIEEALPSVKEAVVADMQAKIVKSIEWDVHQMLGEQVKAYFAEHIKPQVEAQLAEQREEVVAAIVGAAAPAFAAIGELMGKELDEKFRQEMASGRGGRQVVEFLSKVLRGY